MLGLRRGKNIQEYRENYVVFDLETTGVSPYRDAIIEISAVKVRNRQIADTFSMLVNPERPIPYRATMVNHITDQMVMEQPLIAQVMPLFLDFIEEDALVGHNIHCFDMKYIWRIAEQLYGQTISNDYIDTLPMARRILPELSHHKLVDIAEYFGVETAGAHRALNDCIMNQKCYELLEQERLRQLG